MRRATLDDLEAIVDIYNASIPGRLATADTLPVTFEQRLTWFEHHDDRRPLFVHEIEKSIAGWVSLEPFYGRPAYHATAEVSIYVSPDFQGKGIGSLMLKECLAQCPALGIRNVVGYVFSHNQPSLTLLQRHGFKHWGELPEIAEMDGNLYSLSILGKCLDDTP
ncbi:GNAT family N-acetyltransferase [Phytohalomonas tamaricis]|uniref:GNAT family N-acetyltransferase n=1 Tax=Phytohalomonas tamaricis TaxID=2081032 RepID=UPI000D0ACFB3|nr:GNAT family N-acetyltransferase [Phytohalomonas tamaricis]